MSSELGFPKLVCKGVNDVIGDLIVVECSYHVVFGVPTEVYGGERGTTCFGFRKSLNRANTSGSFSPDSDVFIS
jgi:hypothetical protein